MEITEWGLYWITRLDGLCNIELFLVVAFFVFSLISTAIHLAARFDNSSSCEKKEVFWCAFVNAACVVCFFFFMTVFVLTPTTKEMAAIYTIPKVVNNEHVQNIGKNSLESAEQLSKLAADWLKDQAEEAKE